MATHNSVGGNVYITQADEVVLDGDDAGDLAADIGDDLLPRYHGHLATPRPAPADQSGDRYTDCDGPGEFDTDAAYEDALRGGTACYVGFLDHQQQYLFATTLLLVKQADDSLYQVNPAGDDTHCRGDGDPVTRVNRAVNDPECSGSGHGQFIPGSVAIDTTLLEVGAPAYDQLDPTSGSGYLSLPLLFTPYTFLFGQPHPDTPVENRSAFAAGEGPFGPDPAAGGGPLFDLTGACGDRTQDCRLLTPEDVKNYDRNNGNLGDVAGSQARVCGFSPQFSILNPDARDAGLCGVFGSVVNQFLDAQSEGGLAVPGAPGTWQNTLPGWYEGVITASSPGDAALTLRAADEYQCAVDDPAGLFLSSTDCDGENTRVENGLQYMVAVNPAVPTEDHELWCVRPNILATGDENVAGVPDTGFYGDYIADAVDTDVFRRALQTVHKDLSDQHHQAVRTALGPVEAGVAGAQGLAEGGIEDAPLLPAPVKEALIEGLDRATYLETQDAPDTKNPFQVTRDRGIACDGQGVPQVTEDPVTLDGDLVFDTQVSRTGDVAFSVIGLTATQVSQDTAVKDPTLLDEDGPAGESDTNRGAWMARQYSFGGTIKAFLDTSADAVHDDGEAEFSGCALPNGAPQPESDLCRWEPLWDAYNPECTDIEGNPCDGILKERGYNLTAGVGLYFVLKVTGPVVVSDEDLARPNEITDRSDVLGLDDPTAQNCIIGFSRGVQATPAVDAGDVLATECPGHTEGDGKTLVIEDAFDDQSVGGSPGQFSAAVDFAKLIPSPSSGVEETGIGEGDEVCVTGVWNVAPPGIVLDEEDEVVTTGTASDTEGLGDFTLTHDGNPHTWSDCFAFESSA